MSYILFILIGLAVGAVTGVFFFRLDKQWVKYLTVTGGNAGLLAAFSHVADNFQIPADDRLSLATTYIASALFTTLITIICLLRFLKNETQEEDVKFRVLDVLLGHQQAINKYYENRQKLIDKKFNIKDLQDKKKELADQKKGIKSEQEALEATIKEAENLLKQCLCLTLPVDKSVPVDIVFINQIPVFTESLINFSVRLAVFTEEYKNTTDKTDPATLLMGYLLAVCSYTAVYLFDSNSVRVHIRYLNDESGEYQKLIASVGNEKTSDQMTPIPLNTGMISHATKSRRTVIKSLNENYHLEAKHDHIWEDYMTMVFDDEKLCISGNPLLSMGISVKSSEKFKYLMRFLSHCHIEQIIQRHLLSFNEKTNIMETLKGGRAKWPKSA